jgi:hypothetical protein
MNELVDLAAARAAGACRDRVEAEALNPDVIVCRPGLSAPASAIGRPVHASHTSTTTATDAKRVNLCVISRAPCPADRNTDSA